MIDFVGSTKVSVYCFLSESICFLFKSTGNFILPQEKTTGVSP